MIRLPGMTAELFDGFREHHTRNSPIRSVRMNSVTTADQPCLTSWLPDLNQLFRIHDVAEALHALQRGVVAFLGVGSDTIAHDDHEVTTQKTVAHRGLDAAVGGTADHHDRCRPTVAENRLEFVADEHARPSLVDDDVVLRRLEWLHDLPAEAPVEAAWFELAWMVDLFVFHLPAHPGGRFVLPQERGLTGVDRFDSSSGRCGNERRGISNERFFIEGAAGLVVLHVPDQKYRVIGIDDLT